MPDYPTPGSEPASPESTPPEPMSPPPDEPIPGQPIPSPPMPTPPDQPDPGRPQALMGREEEVNAVWGNDGDIPNVSSSSPCSMPELH